MTEQKKADRAGAGAAETSHIAADPAPARRRRQTAARKQEAVLRVLRGEDVELVARSLDATAADISGWRDEGLWAASNFHPVTEARAATRSQTVIAPFFIKRLWRRQVAVECLAVKVNGKRPVLVL